MDSEIKNDTKFNIFVYLKNIGYCLQCCLRLSAIKTKKHLDDISANYNTQDNSVNIEIFEDKNPCVACLGILQSKAQHLVVERIANEAIASEYDSPIFSCNLTVPISLMLREKSIFIGLAQNFTLSELQWYNLKLKSNIKEAWKLQVLPHVEEKISKQYISLPISSCLTIDVSFSYANDEDDCKKLFSNSKCGLSRNKIEKILVDITDAEFMKCFSLPASTPSAYAIIDKISYSHGSIFIGGRYNKLSRQLSQTPWFINGEKKMETSVQDLLSDKIVNYTKADAIKFLSSGREDVDVRTINSGRPFAIELTNPRITKTLTEKLGEIVDQINASTKLIRISSDLKILNLSDLKKLKEGENEKTKFYRALCIVKNELYNGLDLVSLKNIKNLKIIQKTPLRVLHRRAFTPRSRLIHAMRARWLTSQEKLKVIKRYANTNFNQSLLNKLFIIDVKTQAGTYIKEFVHGDFGRTQPNLSEILDVEVDIVALDVTGINIHWP